MKLNIPQKPPFLICSFDFARLRRDLVRGIVSDARKEVRGVVHCQRVQCQSEDGRFQAGGEQLEVSPAG